MIYEFKCPKCDHIWEEQQPMNAEHIANCPECEYNDIKSTITGGTGFLFMDHKTGKPTRGFPSNELKKEKEIQDTEKMLDKTLPKIPQKAIDKSHNQVKKIQAAGQKSAIRKAKKK